MLKYFICLSLFAASLSSSAMTAVEESECDNTLANAALFTQAAKRILPSYRENYSVLRRYINPAYDSSALHRLVILSLKLNEKPEVVGRAFQEAKSYAHIFGMPQIELGPFASMAVWLGIESGSSIDQLLAGNALLLTEIKLRKNLSFEKLNREYRDFFTEVHRGLFGPRLDYDQAQRLFLASTKFAITAKAITQILNTEMHWYKVSSVSRRQTCVWAIAHNVDCVQLTKNIEALTPRTQGRLSADRHESLTYELGLNLANFSSSPENQTAPQALDLLINAYNNAFARTQTPFYGRGSQTIAIKLFRLGLLKPTDQVVNDLDQIKGLSSSFRLNISDNSDYLDILELIYKSQI